QLSDHGLRETADRVGKEDRLGTDADELAALGERRDQLAIEAVLGLEHRGRRRLERLACEGLARARPDRLLRGGERRRVRRKREGAPPLGDATISREALDQRAKPLGWQGQRRPDLLARRARSKRGSPVCRGERPLDPRRERL